MRLRTIWAALMALALPLLVGACFYPVQPCSTPESLEVAASYDWLLTQGHYSEPINRWVRNERLKKFLFKAYAFGGLDTLKSEYGFECIQSDIVPPCVSCSVCRASVVKQIAAGENWNGGDLCANSGLMLMQIDIGPGQDAFSVMTYWQRPPLRSNAGKF